MLNRNIWLTFDWKRANVYTEDSGRLYIDPKVIDFKRIRKDLKKSTTIRHIIAKKSLVAFNIGKLAKTARN